MFVAWFYFLSSAARLGFSEPTLSLLRSSIEPGERALVTLTYPKPAVSALASEPILDSRLIDESRLTVLSTEAFEDEGSYRWQWEVTSYLPETFYFPALMITDGGRTYSTERQAISVQNTRGENDDELRPSFGSLKIPFDWERLFKLLALLAVVSFAIGHLTRRLLKTKPREQPEPAVSPEAWFRAEILRLLSVTPGPQLNDYLEAVHGYFEKLRLTGSSCLTTRELTTERVGKIQYPPVSLLLPILERCDTFRYDAPKENERDLVSQCLSKTLCLIP